jgi:hypothetical protein
MMNGASLINKRAIVINCFSPALTLVESSKTVSKPFGNVLIK